MYNVTLFRKIYFPLLLGPVGQKGAWGRPCVGTPPPHNFFHLSLHFSWFGNILEGFKEMGNFLFLT